MTTTILLYTPPQAAVFHSCRAGWTPIVVDTSTWPHEIREYVALRVDSEAKLQGVPVTPPTETELLAQITAALRKQKEERFREQRQREAQQASEDEARERAQALARSIDALTLEMIVGEPGVVDGIDGDTDLRKYVDDQIREMLGDSNCPLAVDLVLARVDVQQWIAKIETERAARKQADRDEWLCKFAVLMARVANVSPVSAEPKYRERLAARILCEVVTHEEIVSIFADALPIPGIKVMPNKWDWSPIQVGEIDWNDGQWKQLEAAHEIENQLADFLKEKWGLELEERNDLCRRGDNIVLAPVVDLGGGMDILIFEIRARDPEQGDEGD